jgi:hypothetical protein
MKIKTEVLFFLSKAMNILSKSGSYTICNIILYNIKLYLLVGHKFSERKDFCIIIKNGN